MADFKSILTTISQAVDRLGNKASAQQDPQFKAVMGMLKNLDTRGDTLVNNIKNLKLINQVKVKLERLMVSPEYKQELKTFALAFDELQGLHNKYFSYLSSTFQPKKALNVLKKTAIETTLTNLTEVGLGQGVITGISKILTTNISAGGSYAELSQQLRNFMLTNDTGAGALERYVRTYSNTAINQFSAEYNKSVSDDLGLEWYAYTGSLLETSRDFCGECVAKKFIHISEFEAILRGDFGNAGSIALNKKTGLPEGLMAGTNPENLQRRRGGWNCGHQMLAVDESIVPQRLKDAVYITPAYKAWAAKNGKEAKKPVTPVPAATGKQISAKMKEAIKGPEKVAMAVLPFTKPVIDALYKMAENTTRQKRFNEVFVDAEMKVVDLGVAKGGITKIHDGHKKGGRWKETLEMAKGLNRSKIDVGFLPEDNNLTSPDAIVRIKGKFRITDFKHSVKSNSNTLLTAMKNGFNQTGTMKINGHLVLKLESQDLGIVVEAINRLKGDNSTRIGDITFMNKFNKINHITRRDINSGKYIKILRGFF